jgi:hypothetical protein
MLEVLGSNLDLVTGCPEPYISRFLLVDPEEHRDNTLKGVTSASIQILICSPFDTVAFVVETP